MKKVLCILLCFIMVLSMAACTKDDDKGDETSTTATTGSGNGDEPTPTPTPSDAKTRKYVEWDKPEAFHVYVDAEKGMDSNSGLTADKAVATIECAQQIAKAYIEENDSDVVISLAKGNYYVTSGLNVISGTDNAHVYFTSRGGKASILGGSKINSDYVKKCDDEFILGHFPEGSSVRNNLYVADLTVYKDVLTDFINDMTKINTAHSYRAVEFYHGGEELTVSRWPNKEQKVGDVIGNNSEIVGWTITTYINYTNRDGEMKTPGQINSDGTKGTKTDLPMNIFLLDETYERVRSWDWTFNDVYTFDCFSNDWDDMIHKITGFEDFGGYETYGGKSFKGYVITDRGRNYNFDMGAATGDGNTPLRRYYFMNILEEIDLPGEYYYDYENMRLYVYLGEGVSPDDLYIATTKNGTLNVSGKNSTNLIKNVEFHNLNIMYGQEDLVNVHYADKIGFYDCVVSHGECRGFDISNTTNLSVINCDITDTGTQNFNIQSCNAPDRAKPLVSANILIENCDISEPGKRHYSYSASIRHQDVNGVTIRNCTLHDGYHQAIFMQNSTNIIVERNEIYHYVTESDDSGVFYGYMDWVANYGTVFRYNYIHDVGNTWQPYSILIFYQDDKTNAYSVHDNIIANFNIGGKAVGTVFGAMRVGNFYNNIIFNMGENVSIANVQPGYDIQWYWTDCFSSDIAYVSDAGNGYSYLSTAKPAEAWAEWFLSDECDEDAAWTYKHWSYMLSDKFLHETFSDAYLRITSGASMDVNSYARINDDTVFDVAVRVTANATVNVNTKKYPNFKSQYKKGSLITGFTSTKQLTDFLYDYFSFSYDKTASGFSVKYNGEDATLVGNIFNYVPGTGDGEGTYVWSAYAKNGRNDSEVHLSDFRGYFTGTGGSYAFCTSDIGYALYEHNITNNISKDFSSPVTEWNHITAVHKNYWDYDYDIDLFDDEENGIFSIDFEGIVDDIRNSGYDFKLLDITKCGVQY